MCILSVENWTETFIELFSFCLWRAFEIIAWKSVSIQSSIRMHELTLKAFGENHFYSYLFEWFVNQLVVNLRSLPHSNWPLPVFKCNNLRDYRHSSFCSICQLLRSTHCKVISSTWWWRYAWDICMVSTITQSPATHFHAARDIFQTLSRRTTNVGALSLEL